MFSNKNYSISLHDALSIYKYGYKFDVNYFNHLMNEAWYEGSFDPTKDFPNDFTINYFKKFMDDNIDKKEFYRSEEHTSELQSRGHLVCRLLIEKKNKDIDI